jgi:hypothetical protein
MEPSKQALTLFFHERGNLGRMCKPNGSPSKPTSQHVKSSHEPRTRADMNEIVETRPKAETGRRPSMANTRRDSVGRTCKPNVDWATATCHCHRGTTYRLRFCFVSSARRLRLPHLALRYCRGCPESRPPSSAPRPSSSPPAMVGGPVSRPRRPPPFLLALPRTGGGAAGILICPDPSLRDPAFCGGPRRCPLARGSRSGCPSLSLSLSLSLCCKRYGICEWWWPRFCLKG